MVFPPKPRDYEKKMNVKARREAIRSALSLKVKNGEFIVVDKLEMEPKTKEMVKVLANLKLEKKVLLLMAEANTAAIRAGANLRKLAMLPADQANTYDIMNAGSILVTKDAALKITEVFA